jgi:CelD/BcsL family acetyltransferase involved in cellulose biosynthesis
MPIYTINPLRDPRWDRLLSRHPEASAFHSRPWLEALRETYGYEPITYTTTAPGPELTDAIVFCKVRSWLTGRRLVSLPFSDHCQPLVDNPAAFSTLIAHLKESLPRERWEYYELRPFSLAGLAGNNGDWGLSRSSSYYIHVLDLRPDLDTLFHKFHKSCVQRKIARAEREHLVYEEGRSDELLQKFYSLLIMTRRRHGLPPQPLLWFQNLIRSFGENVTLRMASKDQQPLASIFTIRHKNSLVYKYGCSDAAFHNLGGVAMLHWQAIQAAKQQGLAQYDLGRSELDNHGLISFKSNWAAETYSVDYFRYSGQNDARHGSLRRDKAVEAVFSRMPDALLTAAGKLLYRHIG